MASRTRSTSWGAVSIRFASTRLIFFNSSIRLTLVWSRPAVSTIRISTPRATAASRASKATEAGSAPIGCLMISAPTLFPQTSSCSPAAARNVSAQARSTFFPSPRKRYAILPMVVVLPVPFTPTTRMTWGRSSRGAWSRWPSCPTNWMISFFSKSRIPSSSAPSPLDIFSRTSSMILVAVSTPMSPSMSTCSRSSKALSSTRSLPRRTPEMRPRIPARVLANPFSHLLKNPITRITLSRRTGTCLGFYPPHEQSKVNIR